jgi:hypothetical protein
MLTLGYLKPVLPVPMQDLELLFKLTTSIQLKTFAGIAVTADRKPKLQCSSMLVGNTGSKPGFSCVAA